MCRFAYKTYKVTFACFHCRKVFKKPPIEDYMKQHGRTYEQVVGLYTDQLNKCPQCGRLMADLGLSFKAPKKTDEKAWRIIEGMYRIGHAFHTCGCDGFGYVPADAREYRQYLHEKLAEYRRQLQLHFSLAATDGEQADKIAYWKERIEKVTDELVKIGKKR
jgi:hypothetical protein